MRYHNITTDDMMNGDGLRVVLWVAGCNHACKGCHNPVTWDPNCGLEYDEEAENEIYTELSKDHISGITLSGGDPLYPGNRETVTEICRKIKDKFPDKTIWLYTGYELNDVANLEVINYIDILVDGPFIEELKNASAHWVGSTNQRVIDMNVLRKRVADFYANNDRLLLDKLKLEYTAQFTEG